MAEEVRSGMRWRERECNNRFWRPDILHDNTSQARTVVSEVLVYASRVATAEFAARLFAARFSPCCSPPGSHVRKGCGIVSHQHRLVLVLLLPGPLSSTMVYHASLPLLEEQGAATPLTTGFCMSCEATHLLKLIRMWCTRKGDAKV